MQSWAGCDRLPCFCCSRYRSRILGCGACGKAATIAGLLTIGCAPRPCPGHERAQGVRRQAWAAAGPSRRWRRSKCRTACGAPASLRTARWVHLQGLVGAKGGGGRLPCRVRGEGPAWCGPQHRPATSSCACPAHPPLLIPPAGAHQCAGLLRRCRAPAAAAGGGGCQPIRHIGEGGVGCCWAAWAGCSRGWVAKLASLTCIPGSQVAAAADWHHCRCLRQPCLPAGAAGGGCAGPCGARRRAAAPRAATGHRRRGVSLCLGLCQQPG